MNGAIWILLGVLAVMAAFCLCLHFLADRLTRPPQFRGMIMPGTECGAEIWDAETIEVK